MDANGIIAAARDRVKAKRQEERLGQAAFNVLFEVRPDLAERICGEWEDPYYCEEGSSTWDRFMAFLNLTLTP